MGARWPQDSRVADPSPITLLRWLRRQLRDPGPLRERIEAAVANDDPAEARRLLVRFHFSHEQRRHVDSLLEAWERRVQERE